MPTIKEKLDALKKYYGTKSILAEKLNCPLFIVNAWFPASPSDMAQDAINRLYAELKEGE